ncbi:ABC transporter substrate-binding protein [Natrarchaeobius chitinivorans]|uniref:ABC transporter substrate-binding protein n=1 Tax=Natrarchaeobius chitinivorans TaxID=1679083 RepID=A0A3N6M217_NATCH|nr:ABC transporter substrate-binding protein [Natrarchaeobius chitinivorans]RQG95797.1 ABC transporter substrate-binding protein [Natrarchaeobius chitinivorans]
MRKRTLSRRALIGASGTVGTVAIAGCLGSDETTDTFRVGSPWTPDSLDPLTAGSFLKRIGITETLASTNYDTEVAPGLAASWETDDAITWTFDLESDVTFHDGSILDADVVTASLRRVVDSSELSEVPISEVDPVADDRVEIELERPFAPLPAHLTRPETAIVRPDSIDGEEVVEPIATGPFAFDSWTPETSVTAVKHDDYHGTEPTLETVVYEGIHEAETRLLNLQNGDLDMARLLSPSQIETLEADDDLTAHTYPIPRSRYVVFDVDSEPFDDVRVRRAVLHAIDREELTETVLEGVTDVARGPFPESVTHWANEGLEPYDHDPDTATALLSDAAWELDDDVRERDGTSVSIDLWTYSSRPVLPQIATVLQDQLGAVGIDVDVTTMETGAITERTQTEDFDAFIWSNSVLWYPDPDRLADFFHSTEQVMHSGYDNAEVDRLLETARETLDPDERKRLYDEVQTITHEELPIAFLTDYTNVHGLAANVEGYDPHPIESTYGLQHVTT